MRGKKRTRHRYVRIEIICSGPGVILFSLRCCQGPLNRRGIYRIIRLSELKGSALVQSPNFTGEKTQAHLYTGDNTLWILPEDRQSGSNEDLELDRQTWVEVGEERGAGFQKGSPVSWKGHSIWSVQQQRQCWIPGKQFPLEGLRHQENFVGWTAYSWSCRASRGDWKNPRR